MAYQLPRDSQQYVICGMKREHPEEPSSMFKKLDWVDQVIADAAPVKPCHDAVVSKVKVEPCLQEFFTNMLKSRGYSGKTHDTLSCGYNNQPTKNQISSYGIAFTDAVRSSNHQLVKYFLYECGLNPNACNKFGESIVHLVCRRGCHTVLQILIEAGCSVQICDDFGRTPIHDACWTSQPNFDLISMLLDQDPWLLSLKDRRGTTPLGYVKYDSHCQLWIEYLSGVADKYWPRLQQESGESSAELIKSEAKPSSELQLSIPPLCLLEPNCRPIPDSKLHKASVSSISLDALAKVASGLHPEANLMEKYQMVYGIKRITSDSAKPKCPLLEE